MPLVAIPQTLDSMNRSEKSIFKRLQLLYLAQSPISYLYLEPQITNLFPDFILIDPSRGVLIIEVKGWSIDYIKEINNKSVITKNNEELINPTYRARQYFNALQNILKNAPSTLVDKNNNLDINLQAVVIFTDITQNEASSTQIDRFLDHYPVRVIYKDEFNKSTIDTLFNNKIKPLPPKSINIIRATIFPELKIKSQSTSNIAVLDIEQERFAKSLPLGHYMITGIPGSGKSVTLVARAIYLAKKFREWKILIVTYNKLLKNQLSLQIEKIKNELKDRGVIIDNIEVATFHQKALEFSSITPSPTEARDSDFWRYTLPKEALKNGYEAYDAILVDEYQDFYKDWLKFLLKILKPHKDKNNKLLKNIFLAGDRLQSIYNPSEINWKRDIGLDMRGRSKLLKTSYRVTKEHIQLGLNILKNDPKYKEEVEKFYPKEETLLLVNSSKEPLKLIEGDEIKVINQIKELLETYSFKDILLIAPTWARINELKVLFPSNLQYHINSSKDTLSNSQITFTTYYSAKGIEAKVAIVIDIEKIEDRKLFYVAVTRASSKLILHSKSFNSTQIGKEILEAVN
ncbi:MAG: UvrD-helicase domain-containing protein [Epsilonproteobacteria bacterium]|nr:UvrD-helicase domain-containing protein [Campylobacterota bacterium]